MCVNMRTDWAGSKYSEMTQIKFRIVCYRMCQSCFQSNSDGIRAGIHSIEVEVTAKIYYIQECFCRRMCGKVFSRWWVVLGVSCFYFYAKVVSCERNVQLPLQNQDRRSSGTFSAIFGSFLILSIVNDRVTMEVFRLWMFDSWFFSDLDWRRYFIWLCSIGAILTFPSVIFDQLWTVKEKIYRTFFRCSDWFRPSNVITTKCFDVCVPRSVLSIKKKERFIIACDSSARIRIFN